MVCCPVHSLLQCPSDRCVASLCVQFLCFWEGKKGKKERETRAATKMTHHDGPERVRTTTAWIMAHAKHVHIDTAALARLADRMHLPQPQPPRWRDNPSHFWSPTNEDAVV
jgi:hypothetical protein